MRPLFVLPLIVAVYPSLALAQTPPSSDKMQSFFEKADSNHDGFLSLEEWAAAGRRERGFKMIDADGDRKITPPELKAAIAKFRRGG